ncbi:hypothetical protein BDQ17DRAFT_67228 [Cyathus striatus]|nr:hypothetical protein BDQ17DRAFT_67228 [Cyathus striatus]
MEQLHTLMNIFPSFAISLCNVASPLVLRMVRSRSLLDGSRLMRFLAIRKSVWLDVHLSIETTLTLRYATLCPGSHNPCCNSVELFVLFAHAQTIGRAFCSLLCSFTQRFRPSCTVHCNPVVVRYQNETPTIMHLYMRLSSKVRVEGCSNR